MDPDGDLVLKVRQLQIIFEFVHQNFRKHNITSFESSYNVSHLRVHELVSLYSVLGGLFHEACLYRLCEILPNANIVEIFSRPYLSIGVHVYAIVCVIAMSARAYNPQYHARRRLRICIRAIVRRLTIYPEQASFFNNRCAEETC